MRTLAIVHQRDAGPGVFASPARERGDLEVWHIAETNDPPGDPHSYDAVMTFGGAMHADQEDRHAWLRPEKELLRDLLDAGRPLLGVCLGAQILAEAAGGRAMRAREPEIGWFDVEVLSAAIDDPLVGPLAPRFTAFEWHSYEFELPREATLLASTPVCTQAYRIDGTAWGIQFHAEVTRSDAEKWIREHDTDPDAVRIGVDPEALQAQTEERIQDWNRIGAELCARFLDAVAPRPSRP
jgi:GMP synthase-like glutamine amidotransferase